MKMWTRFAVGLCAAAFMLGGPVLDADAQPAKRKERREKRREKIKDRKDKRAENKE